LNAGLAQPLRPADRPVRAERRDAPRLRRPGLRPGVLAAVAPSQGGGACV